MNAIARAELWLEGLTLVVVAAPALRVLLKRPVRRELRAHPVLGVFAIGAGVLTLGVMAWVSLHSDVFRRSLVVVAVVGALVAVFRARASFGVSRGLPPGSLGLATSMDAIGDPDFYAHAEGRWGPVFKMRQIHRPVACVTDMALAQQILHQDDGALGQSDWSFNRLVPAGYVEYMNGDVHAKYRGLLAAGFTNEMLADCRPTIRLAARRQLEEMARQSGSAGIHPEPFLLPVSLASLIHGVFGVSRDSEAGATLESLFIQLLRPVELFLPTPRVTQQTFEALHTAVRDLASDGRRLSHVHAHDHSVLSAMMRAHPADALDATVIGNLILMVKEGSIMVRGLLRWLLKRLAEDPQWAMQLRASEGDAARLDALATSFVLETIRLHENRYVYRVAVRDLRLGPYTVPAGWLVRLCLGEAHEHPARFPSPRAFQPQRFVNGEYDRESFCPFGAGQHACLGADIAVEIAKTFVREAALGYDMSIVRDGAPWRINRHWGLWRPSLQLHVTVSSRVKSAGTQSHVSMPT
ncbi:MAG: cytochrome P450 [Gemmatimonas sp.]